MFKEKPFFFSLVWRPVQFPVVDANDEFVVGLEILREVGLHVHDAAVAGQTREKSKANYFTAYCVRYTIRKHCCIPAGIS